MGFDSYINQLPKEPSKVKMLILKTLWERGTKFPRDWVKSAELLEITQQKYFDRRTRELRDELGCDIETKHIEGEHSYRLISSNLSQYNPRYYLTIKKRDQLFKKHHYICNICGKQIPPGVRGLQSDHRIPLIRNPATKKVSFDINYWQPLCNECNVSKRRSCESCIDKCREYAWAYPEYVGMVFPVRIPSEIYVRIEKKAGGDKRKMEAMVIKAIKNGVSD